MVDRDRDSIVNIVTARGSPLIRTVTQDKWILPWLRKLALGHGIRATLTHNGNNKQGTGVTNLHSDKVLHLLHKALVFTGMTSAIIEVEAVHGNLGMIVLFAKKRDRGWSQY